MSERDTVHFGATKDTYGWFKNLPASLRPALRSGHYRPSGFGQRIVSFTKGNADLASEMYAGQFIFNSKRISASPSEVFSKINTNLEWLSHFNASNRGLHDQFGMRLLHYWSKSKKIKSDITAQTENLIALATDGQMIARRCDAAVQAGFFEIFAQALKALLQLRARTAEQSSSKAIALLYCLNGFQGLGHLREMAYELIERNLQEVILPDGGHRSLNITKLIEFLENAFPLAQLNAPIMPPTLLRAVENGLALLKLLQCPDGKRSGLLSEVPDAAVLQQLLNDQNIEIPKLNFAPHAGFARIEHDKATLIADTSTRLGIDFSAGKQRLIKTGLVETGQMKPAILQSVPQGTVLMMESVNQKRTCFLSTDGNDLRIEDEGPDSHFIIHVAYGIRLSSLMEGQAVMFVLPDHSVWHLKQRGGILDIRQSNSQSEIVIHPKDAGKVNWSLKKQAKPVKASRKKPSFESDLLI